MVVFFHFSSYFSVVADFNFGLLLFFENFDF